MDWRQICRLLLIAVVAAGCGSGPTAPSVSASSGATTNPVFQSVELKRLVPVKR